ncbi:MAG: AhpC/TSA family protein [Bacteroidales bacterium]|nr:AhpC/TSA family protein [Bacteroidales bacterium]
MKWSSKKDKILFFLILISQFIFQSCIDRIDRVSVDGFLTGNPKTYIYVNRFEGDSLSLIDSIKTNSKGHFKIKLKVENPYFVTIGKDRLLQPIMLLVQPGDEVKIKASEADLSDYSVLGSNGSVQIWELNLRLNSTKLKIDSLKSIYNSNTNNPKIDSVKHLLDSLYNLSIDRHCDYTHDFIKNNPFSPVSILALFQTYDNSHPVLDYAKDRKLFRMVDSSLMSVYSSNSIVKAYHSKIQKLDSLYELRHKRALMFKDGETLPDVGYPLINGDYLFISNIWFRYILVDFWGDWCSVCASNNEILRQIYKEYAPKGLVVIQVSLGTNPDTLILRAVRDSLPWYHSYVDDFYNSRLLDTLKISSLPSNYITDRRGVIKGVNLNGEKLKSKLTELLP